MSAEPLPRLAAQPPGVTVCAPGTGRIIGLFDGANPAVS